MSGTSVEGVLVETDTETGATYFTLRDAPVVRTIHVRDLVMVDVGEDGAPVGVEFALPYKSVTEDDLTALFDAFPTLKEVLRTPRR